MHRSGQLPRIVFQIFLPKKSGHFWSQCSDTSRQDTISAANLRDKYLLIHPPNSLCRNVHLKWNCKGLLHLADAAKMIFLSSSCHLPCRAGRCELYPGHPRALRELRDFMAANRMPGPWKQQSLDCAGGSSATEHYLESAKVTAAEQRGLGFRLKKVKHKNKPLTQCLCSVAFIIMNSLSLPQKSSEFLFS